MKLRSFFLILFLLLPVAVKSVLAGEVRGRVYDIIEQDILLLIQERARSVDSEKYLNRKKIEKAIIQHKPKWKSDPRPRASVTKEFLVDITAELEFDIIGSDGKVIFPKGYKINPLEHIAYRKKLVFIDSTDIIQLNWLENSKYLKDMNTLILLVDGDYYNLSKKYKRMFYYAPKIVVDRLKITEVPAVAVQKGNKMKVTIVGLK